VLGQKVHGHQGRRQRGFLLQGGGRPGTKSCRCGIHRPDEVVPGSRFSTEEETTLKTLVFPEHPVPGTEHPRPPLASGEIEVDIHDQGPGQPRLTCVRVPCAATPRTAGVLNLYRALGNVVASRPGGVVL